MTKKTWVAKRDCNKTFKIKSLQKKFADMPEGTKMLIVTPLIIDTYVKKIPKGIETSLTTMRDDLASMFSADKTCPVTKGIFLRIVSEAAYEEFLLGDKTTKITPFWRVVSPTSKLAQKLTCGVDFILKQRKNEAATEILG